MLVPLTFDSLCIESLPISSSGKFLIILGSQSCLHKVTANTSPLCHCDRWWASHCALFCPLSRWLSITRYIFRSRIHWLGSKSFDATVHIRLRCHEPNMFNSIVQLCVFGHAVTQPALLSVYCMSGTAVGSRQHRGEGVWVRWQASL